MINQDKIIVTGNVSDNPFAIDMAQLLGIVTDISDLVSLKTFANTEFCPRYINDENDLENIGHSLEGYTVIICSTSDQMCGRNNLGMRNCILARAAKDNGADRVLLIEPDLFYSAQDRGPSRFGTREDSRSMKDQKKFDGQAFTAKLYAELLKLSGVDCVITVHNHSVKVQELFTKIFDGNFHNLIPSDIYADYIKHSDMVEVGKDGDNLVLCAPDKGAVPFVKRVAETLDLPKCQILTLQKDRRGERKVSVSVSTGSEAKLEDIQGKDVIVLDDMVRTGHTIVESCRAIKEGEPNRVCFGVTHFYTSPEAREHLNHRAIDEIMTSNTIPTILNRDSQGRLRKKLVVLKMGKWISKYVLGILELDNSRFEKDFYGIDMSSKNPRWRPHIS